MFLFVLRSKDKKGISVRHSVKGIGICYHNYLCLKPRKPSFVIQITFFVSFSIPIPPPFPGFFSSFLLIDFVHSHPNVCAIFNPKFKVGSHFQLRYDIIHLYPEFIQSSPFPPMQIVALFIYLCFSI